MYFMEFGYLNKIRKSTIVTFVKFPTLVWQTQWQMFLLVSRQEGISIISLKGRSQPHLCFCLHARIWLLYFIRSLLKQRKITVELLKIIKHTFWNTAYSKAIRNRFTMLY